MFKKETDLRRAAIAEGISGFVEKHSRYAQDPSVLYTNLDKTNILNIFSNAMIYGSGGSIAIPFVHMTDKEKEAVFKYMTREVAKGGAFRDAYTKRVLPGKTGKLEKVLDFVTFKRNRAEPVAKYLDETSKIVYGMLPTLAAKGAPEEIAPVIDAAGRFTRENYRSALADEAVSYGITNEWEYRAAKRDIHGKAKKSYEDFKTGLRKFISGEKIAASILGIAGIGILFLSGRQLTGSTVGNIGIYPGLGFFVGIGLTFASFLLFAKISRDRKKSVYMRR